MTSLKIRGLWYCGPWFLTTYPGPIGRQKKGCFFTAKVLHFIDQNRSWKSGPKGTVWNERDSVWTAGPEGPPKWAGLILRMGLLVCQSRVSKSGHPLWCHARGSMPFRTVIIWLNRAANTDAMLLLTNCSFCEAFETGSLRLIRSFQNDPSAPDFNGRFSSIKWSTLAWQKQTNIWRLEGLGLEVKKS